MSVDQLRDWGQPGDGQGTRLFAAAALSVATIGFVFLYDGDQGEPAMDQHPAPVTIEQSAVTPTCGVEDEVVVKVVVDAFDLDAGVLRCVHIDHLRPERTTP